MLKRKKLTQTEPQPQAAPDPKLAKLINKPFENLDREEEEEDQPKKGSLDHVMRNVTLSSNAKNVPAGPHEAIITEFVLQAPDTKGRSARIKFELPEFPTGKNELVTWFKLLEEDLVTEVTGGVKALKMALARLGYDEPESEKELRYDLAKITKEQPGVVVSVSYDGQWQRIRIEDTSESEVIERYKDNIPF